jgi:hypothetical protein
MNRKYLVNNIGIGDLIFFCCSIMLNHKINETIEVKLSRSTLSIYRENSENYKIFCEEYIKYFLSDYTLNFLSDNSDTNYVWELNSDLYNNIFKNDLIIKKIKNKLDLKKDNHKDCIVIFTKIRELHSSLFSMVSEEFFNYINQSDKKVILLGEKEVKYGSEYAIHGKQKIYSIYNKCIDNINKDKVIDLTINIYEFNNFSLNSIINDINIIINSSETYVFGGGGFFCLSLFTGKLISLTNHDYKQLFYSKYNQNIFSEMNEFTNFLKN